MGTPEFVLPILSSTEQAASVIDGEIVAVYTAPDRPTGRGRKLLPSPVKAYAEAQGFDVVTPARVTNDEEKARFAALGADLVVLAAYGLLLPAPFLFDPQHGAVNVHPSLLPRHRGASPVAGAILAGDTRAGTAIMKMDEGLDTGDVLAMEEVGLVGDERAPALTKELFALGARMLGEVLPAYVSGSLQPTPQALNGVTVIKRFKKQDGELDWSMSAVELERRIRAYDPWPGTASTYRGERLDVLSATVGETVIGERGEVVAHGRDVVVVTGDGSLVLGEVKPAGRKPMTANDFVRGHPDFVGAMLPS